MDLGSYTLKSVDGSAGLWMALLYSAGSGSYTVIHIADAAQAVWATKIGQQVVIANSGLALATLGSYTLTAITGSAGSYLAHLTDDLATYLLPITDAARAALLGSVGGSITLREPLL